MVYQRKEMSQYNLDEGGQVCEDCGLEDVELFGGLCEDCDNEMFATFWTGETDE
jgi:NMD protein affecting ribosome stability and mRNA decay|tara:strand:- start:720 stop:881 length:162 start_codon:yes stop_codon:yes gene_type:complete